MSGRVARLCRYPVKGLDAQELDRVDLMPRRGLPRDRRYAIAHGSTRFEAGAPHWMAKTHFLMLARNPRLALLSTDYDEADETLVVRRDGKPVVRGCLADPLGRQLVEQFLAAFLGGDSRGMPRVVRAEAESFTVTRDELVSIINLASIADVERVVRAPVDPLRFRGNVYLDGVDAWRERDWPGRTLRLGGAELRVLEPIERCAATNVDPATGAVDRNIPKSLLEGFRHADCGVYAEVVTAGPVATGDPAALI